MRVALFVVVVAALVAGCKEKNAPGERQAAVRPTPAPRPAPPEPETPPGPPPITVAPPSIPEVDGLAIAIAVDRSGSMQESIGDSVERKENIARRAIARALEATKSYVAKRPDFPVKVGVLAFSSEATVVSPMDTYNEGRLADALDDIPFAHGETAIGDAIVLARRELNGSGLFRKHIIVITDGENTMGAEPQDVLADMVKTGGGTMAHFVAFDVDAKRFEYVSKHGGALLSAQDSTQLETALQQVYEAKILAEAFEE